MDFKQFIDPSMLFKEGTEFTLCVKFKLIDGKLTKKQSWVAIKDVKQTKKPKKEMPEEIKFNVEDKTTEMWQ